MSIPADWSSSKSEGNRPAGAAAILLGPGVPTLTAQLREVGRGRVAGPYNVAYSVDVEAAHAFVTGNLGINVFSARAAQAFPPANTFEIVLDDVEYATLEWVAWYNSQRLLEPLGYLQPAE